ncbi:phosphocholine cytidylyltransferase family protein [Verminephrobacter aporrectodeae subsp. tuberculatae]|uniref:phosphocholine cytidylyltransferase family protein n=1 Tax=Verminephrobacter aporrectodeae TaxID=1110389 RepID=UPI000237571F|nr:phosphocholine cytidylyltransferase family protein [Verminephrobacter aporrectodeae]MCW8164775.1 phosphocholine cytidylyltransferase family protein [Verminephrobacter aporrectodeae subsp. tuberculatae]MCW8169147.1 phosphocholine cytidylyltransferase family protein [Verminephrobacter aporrectodeae subsp. tuberculatae]MCW8209346.1 phosphocholine cytidylyltransferase family protein [Verminephrobacter aporrectodeae subsp. tuberculatae]
MKRALILAAGMGTRLHPFTADRPKALVEFRGDSMIERAVAALRRSGIREIGIVIGYKGQLLRDRLTQRFGSSVDISYFESDRYESTGTAYSFLLAAAHFRDDCLLLEGDVVFEDALLSRLLNDGRADSLATLAAFRPPLEGTTVDLRAADRIVDFHKRTVPGTFADRFKTINVYRFTRSDLAGMLDRAKRLVHQDPKAYLEDVLGALVRDAAIHLRGIDCTDLLWAEIDTAEDMHLAELAFGAFPAGAR